MNRTFVYIARTAFTSVIIFALNTLIVLFATTFCLSCNNSIKEQPASTDRTDVLDSLQLTDMDGQPFNMQQVNGKVLFVNFWATWCKPCILEMPSIANAEKLLSDKVTFIMASPEALEEIASFREKNSYPFLFTRVDNMESLGITALPTTFIFSSDGKLIFSEAGARKWDDSTNLTLINQIISNE